MLLHTNLIKPELQGPNPTICVICLYGLQDKVLELEKSGHTKKKIVSLLKSYLTREHPNLKENINLNTYNIGLHRRMCLGDELENIKIVRKARRDLKMQKKTISEVNEMVMDHIVKGLSIAEGITPEQIEAMPVKDRMSIANDAAKLLQGEKKIAMEAKRTNMEEAKFLQDVGKLASGAIGYSENEAEPVLELK